MIGAYQHDKGVKIDDLDGQEDDQKGYRSLLHGEAPVIKLLEQYITVLEDAGLRIKGT